MNRNKNARAPLHGARAVTAKLSREQGQYISFSRRCQERAAEGVGPCKGR